MSWFENERERDQQREWVKKRAKQKRHNNRKALSNLIERYNLEDRARWLNPGAVCIDEKFYYYCQKKIAKVKGVDKQYQMRGVQHFYDIFIKEDEGVGK